MIAAADPRAAYNRTYKNYSFTVPDAIYRSVAEGYIARFNELLKEWRSATTVLSFVAQKKAHPSFSKMVELGDTVIPLIIHELRIHPDFLNLALEEIVKEENVAPNLVAGIPRANVDAWIRWFERTDGHAD